MKPENCSVPFPSLASVALKIGFVEDPTAGDDAKNLQGFQFVQSFDDKWCISCIDDR